MVRILTVCFLHKSKAALCYTATTLTARDRHSGNVVLLDSALSFVLQDVTRVLIDIGQRMLMSVCTYVLPIADYMHTNRESISVKNDQSGRVTF